jgi:hypothetical protein
MDHPGKRVQQNLRPGLNSAQPRADDRQVGPESRFGWCSAPSHSQLLAPVPFRGHRMTRFTRNNRESDTHLYPTCAC